MEVHNTSCIADWIKTGMPLVMRMLCSPVLAQRIKRHKSLHQRVTTVICEMIALTLKSVRSEMKMIFQRVLSFEGVRYIRLMKDETNRIFSFSEEIFPNQDILLH